MKRTRSPHSPHASTPFSPHEDFLLTLHRPSVRQFFPGANCTFSSETLTKCLQPHLIRPSTYSARMAPSRLSRLPRWINHWLGYRPEAPKPLPTYQIALWSFITSFCGLSVIQGLFNYSHYFTSRHVPGIIASYVRTSSPSQTPPLTKE